MNIDIDYEKKFLDDFILMLKIYKPFLFSKINQTGIIASLIGQAFDIQNPEYYLAGFYANVGMLSMIKYSNQDKILSKDEKDIVKRHPILSAEYLKKRGMEYASKLAYLHHEKPDGSGYYKESNFPKEASFINIADTFQGCLSPKNYRPPFTINEALDIALKDYKNYLFLSKEEVAVIEKVLRDFYGTL